MLLYCHNMAMNSGIIELHNGAAEPISVRQAQDVIDGVLVESNERDLMYDVPAVVNLEQDSVTIDLDAIDDDVEEELAHARIMHDVHVTTTTITLEELLFKNEDVNRAFEKATSVLAQSTGYVLARLATFIIWLDTVSERILYFWVHAGSIADAYAKRKLVAKVPVKKIQVSKVVEPQETPITHVPVRYVASVPMSNREAQTPRLAVFKLAMVLLYRDIRHGRRLG